LNTEILFMNYKFEPTDEKFSPTKILEIEQEIHQSIEFLQKHLERLLDYLKAEKNLGNYIEISLPVLDLSITYKINLFYDKILISVFKYDFSEFYGYVLFEDLDCLDSKKLKIMGNWNYHSNLINRYKALGSYQLKNFLK